MFQSIKYRLNLLFVCYLVLCFTTVIYSVLCLGFCLIRRTLVIFDSRGRRVLIDDPSIICCVYPGASLLSVGTKIEEMLSRYNPTTCLIMVGVNDLTDLNPTTRKVSVTMGDPFSLANRVISKILALRSRLLNYWPGVKIIFAGITGIDLNRYNRCTGISGTQWIIDDCIMQINSFIRLMNRNNGWYHPRLTSKVHIWRNGRRVNRYHLLSDGLHPGPVVITSWLVAIARCHRINTLAQIN